MATVGTNPTSALLQDMLREKKAQTQRVKKTYDSTNRHLNGLGDRDVQSSPIASMSSRDSRRGSGVGVRSVTTPKEMGFKEMEEYISKINKQNFDLKLEVFHRRQRNEALDAKLQKLQALEANNEELQSINEELLLELEKRDLAIQEAVGLICELEAKNEELEMTVVKMDFTRSPTTSDSEPSKEGNGVIVAPLSTISGMEQSGPSICVTVGVQTDPQAEPEHSLSAPDTLSPPKGTSAHRVPSFMRDMKKSTTVLRSMYSSDGNASFISLPRPTSLFSGEDDDDPLMDRQMTNSPRLSILSESGFSSVYGGRKDQLFRDTDEKGEPAETSSDPEQRIIQRESRLHKWLDERDMPRTPSPKITTNDRVSSIGEVLSQVSPSRDRALAETVPAGQHTREQRTPEKQQTKPVRSPKKSSASPTLAGPIFGGAVLPPTPDTMSTATLDKNSSTPSIITEKSLLDGTPYPPKAYSTLPPAIRPTTSDSVNGSVSPGSFKDSNRQGMSSRNVDPGGPRRPSLKTYGTETSSGESLLPAHASRTLSYPSPTGRARRLSDQQSSRSYKSSDSNSEKTVNQSPREQMSSGDVGIITPNRGRPSPLPAQEPTAPSPITALPHLPTPPDRPRSSSLRSKIASKFGRSNGGNNNNNRILNPTSNLQDSIPSRPPVTRSPATTHHARPPRPASLSGQHPIPNSHPSPVPVPSSKLHPSPARSPSKLHPILPQEMLTDLERYSADSARNVERHHHYH